jgi:WD40-like Beta Propeller Repeat
VGGDGAVMCGVRRNVLRICPGRPASSRAEPRALARSDRERRFSTPHLSLAFILSAFAWLVLVPAALAARGHAFSLAFPDLAEPGHLSLGLVAPPGGTHAVSGVAISATSGDVFVADTGNRRVDVFSPSGTFLRAWGWGVATGASELQVCTSSCLQGLSGSAPGEFEAPAFVAVDNDASSPSFGDVYVGDAAAGNDLVSKFDGEGHLIASWGNNGENASKERVEPNGQLNGETVPEKDSFSGGFPEAILAGVAVDGAGDLRVFSRTSNLFNFDQGGGFVAKCSVPTAVGAKGIAVGPSTVYVVEGFGGVERVAEGKCSSKPTAVTSDVRPASGLALDPFDGDLYVDGDGGLVEDLPAGCLTSKSLCQPRGVFGEVGEGALNQGVGIGIDPHSGTVYVGNAGTQQVFAYGVVVEADPAPVEGVAADGAVLHGTANPDGSQLTHCEFEYGPTTTYGSVVACEESLSSIGAGSSPVAVQAKVERLNGGTPYHFRLRAANAKGDVRSEDEVFETSKTARILKVFTSEASASSAVLNAVVNPEALEGAYHFELGECASLAACPSSGYPTSLGAGTLTAGNSEVVLSAQAEGLLAGHIYHFRIVVKDTNGLSSPDPEGTLVVGPAPVACEHARAQPGSDGLPDCRAYEMVTPPAKNGALVYNGAFIMAPAFSSDGSRVLARSIQCFSEPQSCVADRLTEGEPFAFERTGSGWLTTPLAPPPSFAGTLLQYRGDSGLMLYAAPPAEGQPEQFYVRRPDGSLSAVGPLGEAPGVAIAGVYSSTLVATSDFSHVVYEGDGLWSFDHSVSSASIYEYPGEEGHPVLVSVTGEKRDSTDLIGACGAAIGGETITRSLYGTLSSDGRTVVFTVEPCATGTGTNEGVPVPARSIYERIEAAGGQMATVLVSGPGPNGACSSKACLEAPPAPASFEGASFDGTRVFFTSTHQLTDNASEDRRTGDTSSGNGCDRTARDTAGCNLYLWECPNHCEDKTSERLVDVSAGDLSGLGAQVQGVAAISPEGSSVYFVAHGVLTGPNRAGVAPAPGGENLYVYGPDQEGKHRVAFIATLAGPESAQSDAFQWEGGIGEANVTPDGRYLVFTSHRALTGDVSRFEGPAQVYRYDASEEELVRVSTGQEGFNDNGNNGTGDARVVRAADGFTNGRRADPSMSDDGRFVFFQSPVGLTPAALDDVTVRGNSKVLSQNVYAWEAAGTKASNDAPACGQPGGCVSLISDGRDVSEGANSHSNESAVELLGADTSGHNVFFETADQLVAGDTDSQVDFYDARVDGGFPAGAEIPPCASLEECHPPVAQEPAFPPVASSVFSGLGNLIPGPQPIRPPPVVRLTAAQLLAKALSACHRKPHGHARVACERAAHSAYRARLLSTAIAVCHKQHGRSRARCERRARARYGKARTRGGGR